MGESRKEGRLTQDVRKKRLYIVHREELCSVVKSKKQ